MKTLDKKSPSFFYILPVILVLVVIVIFPLIYSLVVSFYDYDLRKEAVNFIGLQNFIELSHDERFLSSLLRTTELIILSISVQFLLGLMLALILYYHSSKLRNFLIVILSIPPMISPLVVSYIGRLIFHPGASPINYILEVFNLPHNISWHASTQTSLITIFLIDSWQWTPFIMLLLFSGLIAIPEEYLESARIDGATSLKEVRYIILPLLKPTMIVAILFRSLDIIRMFDLVYGLTGGGPGTSSEVSSFYIYLTSFPYWRIGYGAALSWIFMIIVSIIITIYLRYIIKTF